MGFHVRPVFNIGKRLEASQAEAASPLRRRPADVAANVAADEVERSAGNLRRYPRRAPRSAPSPPGFDVTTRALAAAPAFPVSPEVAAAGRPAAEGSAADKHTVPNAEGLLLAFHRKLRAKAKRKHHAQKELGCG